jgi:hypothetical protein
MPIKKKRRKREERRREKTRCGIFFLVNKCSSEEITTF